MDHYKSCDESFCGDCNAIMCGQESVYAYTFATANGDYDIPRPSPYMNIFNIINKTDLVPFLPPTTSWGTPPPFGYARHGREAIVDMVGTTYINAIANHSMATYLDWMDNNDFETWDDLMEESVEYFWESEEIEALLEAFREAWSRLF